MAFKNLTLALVIFMASSLFAFNLEAQTTCSGNTYPYSHGFDSVTAPALSPCWNIVQNGGVEASGSRTVNTNDVGLTPPSSPNLIELNDANQTFLISPKFTDLPNGNKSVTFKASDEDASGDELIEVGVMADTSTIASYIPIDTVNPPNGNFQEFTVPLNNSNLIGNNEHIALRHLQVGAFEVFIDDFHYDTLKPDIAVTNNYTLGKIRANNDHEVQARVVNNGVPQSNVPVTLNITGANNFTSTVNIPTFNTGDVFIVTFNNPSFTPTNLGTDTVTVSVPNDSNNTNNSVSVVQEVTNNNESYVYPAQPLSAGGVGFNGATGDFVANFNTPTADSIIQVNVNFDNAGLDYQIGVWDATGAGTPGTLLYETDTLQTVAGQALIQLDSAVQVNGDFFVGVRQVGTNNVTFKFQNENPPRQGAYFFTSPSGNANWFDFAPGNPFRFAVEIQYKSTSPPLCAIKSYPPDDANGVPIDSTLNWSSNTGTSGGSANGFLLYLDSNLTNVQNQNQTALVDTFTTFEYSLTNSNLPLNTTYYWNVVPFNSVGEATNCKVDSFTTEIGDIGITRLLKPESTCGLTSNESVKVVFENRGNLTIPANTMVPVGYQLGNNTSVSESYMLNSAFNPGDTINYTFNNTIDLSQSGTNYNFQTWTGLQEDNTLSNDTFSTGIFVPFTPQTPTINNDTFCQGKAPEFAPSSNTSFYHWYDSATGGTFIANSGNTYTTSAFNQDTTFYVEAASSPKKSLLITESALGTDDSIEIQNVSDDAVDANGWVVAVSDSYSDINQFNTTLWNLGNISKDQVIFRTDAGGTNGWGSNILWDPNLPGWAIIIDDQGEVVDFVAWGWSQSDLQNFNPTINGFNITLGDQWSGSGTNACNTGSNVIRTGSLDDNDASNFTCGSPNVGSPNPQFNYPEVCTSSRVSANAIARDATTTFMEGSPFDGSSGNQTMANPDSVCVGDTVTYKFPAPGNYSNSQYGNKWEISGIQFETMAGAGVQDTNFTAATSNSDAQLRYVADPNEGDQLFEISVNVNLLSACDTSFSNYLYVEPSPQANFALADSCPVNLQFNNTSNLPSQLSTSSWDFGDGGTSSNRDPVHTYGQSGNYNVELVLTSQQGCGSDTANKNVQIAPKPQVDFSFDTTCQNQSITFTNNSSISTGSLNYQWDFGNGQTSTNVNGTQTYNTPNNKDVTLTATSNKGCSNSITKTVGVDPTPNTDFTIAGSQYCQGDTLNFINETTNQGLSPSYEWDFDNGDVSVQKDADYAYSSSGSFNVSLTTSTDSGCINTQTKQITVDATPQVDFNIGNTSICKGNAVQFNNGTTFSGSVNYNWFFGDGNSSNQTNASNTYNTTGEYQVTLEAIPSQSGCQNSMTKPIKVGSNPTADFTATSDACEGSTVQFNDNSQYQGNEQLNYDWDLGNTTADAKDTTVTYNTANNYTVSLTLSTDSTNCSDSQSESLTIHANPEIVNLSNDGECTDQLTNFSTQVNYSGDSLDHSWDFGDGTFSTQAEPNHEFTSSGNYDVQYIATSPTYTCADTISQNLDVTESPSASFQTPQLICTGEAVTFTNSSQGGAGSLSYDWDFDNGQTSTDQEPNITFNDTGDLDVSLVATESNNNCTDTATQMVTVNETPNSNFSVDKNGSQVVLNTANNTYASYEWDFGDGESSFEVNPVHTYGNTGQFPITLNVETNAGCSSQSTDTVNIATSINEKLANSIDLATYPNPFKEAVNINYELPNAQSVKMQVVDQTGRTVSTLIDEQQGAGKHEVEFEPAQHGYSSGVFILKLWIDEQSEQQMLINIE